MIEPVVCVANATGTIPAATAAAEPDDDPPGVRVTSCGLTVGPGGHAANSVVTSFPSGSIPDRRAMATLAASTVGRCPAWIGDPYAVGMSCVSKMSLTPMRNPVQRGHERAAPPGRARGRAQAPLRDPRAPTHAPSGRPRRSGRGTPVPRARRLCCRRRATGRARRRYCRPRVVTIRGGSCAPA